MSARRIHSCSSATHPDPAARLLAFVSGLGSPELAQAGLRQLELCLEPLRSCAWTEVAWNWSRLTSDGCPIELAFSAHDDRLRITFEPAGPECKPSDKLAAAMPLLDRLQKSLPRELIRGWRRMQQGGRLRWGTWLGLRQTGDRFRPKLYLEVPDGAPVSSPFAAGGGKLRMIGFEPEIDRAEFYFSLPRLSPVQLSQILAASGVEDHSNIIGMLELCLGVPLAAGLRWAQLGFSRAVKGESPLPAAGIFFRARAVKGGRLCLHKRLQQMALHSGPNSAYGRFLNHAAARTEPAYEMISLAADPSGYLEWRAALSASALRSPFPGSLS